MKRQIMNQFSEHRVSTNKLAQHFRILITASWTSYAVDSENCTLLQCIFLPVFLVKVMDKTINAQL